jgi:hypothetical protein
VSSFITATMPVALADVAVARSVHAYTTLLETIKKIKKMTTILFVFLSPLTVNKMPNTNKRNFVCSNDKGRWTKKRKKQTNSSLFVSTIRDGLHNV